MRARTAMLYTPRPKRALHQRQELDSINMQPTYSDGGTMPHIYYNSFKNILNKWHKSTQCSHITSTARNNRSDATKLSHGRTIARTLQWWRRLVSVNLEEHNMQFSDSSSGTQSPDSETFFERRLASMRQPTVIRSAWFTHTIVPREPIVTILLISFTHHRAERPS